MSSSYRGDPHWLTLRYSAVCRQCGGEIYRGDKGFYYPRGKSLFCAPCGRVEAALFAAMAADEDQCRR